LASFFKGVASLLPEFVGGACEGKKVCFVPTASIPEKVTFYVGADRKAMVRLGMDVDDLEVSSASKAEITDKITGADYLFVSGGNTFFLLQELRRTGADSLVVAHITSGKTYIGASAGSMVLSENLEYVCHMDSPKAAPDLGGDFTGLGVVDFCVVPHATNVPFKKAAQKILDTYSGALDLRPISNDQAITVAGETVQIVTR
jgi:dipeptidase E